MRFYHIPLLFCFLFALPVPSSAQSSGPVGAYLDLDGDSLYHEVFGEGFPVVLVSGGSGMDLYQWSRVTPVLAEKYRVILVDPRGVGRSSNPTSRYSDGADIERLVHHLNLDRIVIVGLSSAGGTVLAYALEYPDRVAGVVASAAFMPGYQFSQEMRARLDAFSAAAEEGREPFLEAMFEDPHFIPAPLDRFIRPEARANMGWNYDKSAGFDSSLPIALEPALIERLGDIKPPVLLVVGELDHPEVFRRNQFYLDRLPAASEKQVPSAGHNQPLENPSGFVEAISGFLETVRMDY